MLISTDVCESCLYGHIDEINKGTIYVTCDKHEGSKWFYGQYTNCNDDYKKRIDEEEEE